MLRVKTEKGLKIKSAHRKFCNFWYFVKAALLQRYGSEWAIGKIADLGAAILVSVG